LNRTALERVEPDVLKIHALRALPQMLGVIR